MTRVVLLFVALFSAYAIALDGPLDLTDIIVTESGHDPDNSASACADFKLTNKEVSQYFSKAKVISTYEKHYEYAWSPCYVRGRGKLSGRLISWEMREAGTATMIGRDGIRIFFGDETQRLEVPQEGQ